MRLNHNITKQEEAGSITVFLSLILLLILSLILTITEGARISSAKAYAGRALSTAMDSVLAQYYGPLWEEYHVFGLYPGTDSDEKKKDQLAKKLTDYMSYTFQPDKNIANAVDNRWELLNIQINQVSAEDMTGLMDYQGQLLINEAVEYMKYREIGEGVELLLDKLSLMQTPGKVSYVYEKKQTAEEKLIEVDQGILELMELLDGIKTSKKGIEVSKTGSLKLAEYFVKKLCPGDITKEAVGINQENIFQALKDSYVNPAAEFNTIEACMNGVDQLLGQMDAIQIHRNTLINNISSMQSQLSSLYSTSKKSKEVKRQISALENAINSVAGEINSCDNNLKALEEAKRRAVSQSDLARSNISDLISGIKPLISKAVKLLEDIIYKTKTAAPYIEEYEKTLGDNREQIGEEAFSGLQESLAQMKKYVSVKDSGYDFAGMKEILNGDLTVLTKVESYLIQGDRELAGDNYQGAKINYNNACQEIMNYRIRDLDLDYSTLVFDKSGKENPLNSISELFMEGIISLVIDPGQISEEKLTCYSLPSETAQLLEDNKDFAARLKEFFQTAAKGFHTQELFQDFAEEADILELLGNGTNQIASHLLYQEYLKEHFEAYSSEEDSSSHKPCALLYEQEYLLSGHTTDKENLSDAISRILFLRTILDFTSILGDSTKRNEAQAVAAAIVGFTGLAALVSVTQVLILLAWAFGEALLDVSALLMGKEVPLLKKKLVLEFPELFTLNRQFLQTKAASLKTSKELTFTYQDYLRMFLLIKSKKELAYRSMDLMQEDIKLRYTDQDFNITSCLFGFSASMEYIVPSKFTGIYFVQKLLNTSTTGFRLTTQTADSY